MFTEKALADLGISPDGMQAQAESYEHLGQVQTFSLNLRQRYQELVDQRVAFATPEEALATASRDFPIPPHAVWEWLNDPYKRTLCLDNPHAVMKPIFRPGGRARGPGRATTASTGKRWPCRRPSWIGARSIISPASRHFLGLPGRDHLPPDPHPGWPGHPGGRGTHRSLAGARFSRSPQVFLFMTKKINSQAQFLDQMARIITQQNAQPSEEGAPSSQVPGAEQVSSRG